MHLCEIGYCGILQVLSALERIEQDDLTYEVCFFSSYLVASPSFLVLDQFLMLLQQLVSLETNLFLNSLNVYDQHRDMRMDIDNMSYEVITI